MMVRQLMMRIPPAQHCIITGACDRMVVASLVITLSAADLSRPMKSLDSHPSHFTLCIEALSPFSPVGDAAYH
ncbi:hypothetical protein RRG08_049905 [Elysia crispata]|uniref:Uncharacterized protein n=1 Tax=Elysia crispata TaxID=231223 RepID=A0AAE0XZ84_9GAST|nr:hypothetical protein RRG08_049905 [Elysia crispata]